MGENTECPTWKLTLGLRSTNACTQACPCVFCLVNTGCPREGLVLVYTLRAPTCWPYMLYQNVRQYWPRDCMGLISRALKLGRWGEDVSMYM